MRTLSLTLLLLLLVAAAGADEIEVTIQHVTMTSEALETTPQRPERTRIRSR